MLTEKKMLNLSGRDKDDKFIVSDNADKFKTIGSKFLGYTMEHLEQVDFDEFLQTIVMADNQNT